MAKKMTIDQGFDSLEEIIEKMESDNISLGESCQLYGKDNCIRGRIDHGKF